MRKYHAEAPLEFHSIQTNNYMNFSDYLINNNNSIFSCITNSKKDFKNIKKPIKKFIYENKVRKNNLDNFYNYINKQHKKLI